MRQRRVAGQTSSNCLFDLISSECDEVKIFNQKTKCRRQGPGNNYHVFFMSLCNVQFGGGTAIENVRHKASGCTMWKWKCIAAIINKVFQTGSILKTNEVQHPALKVQLVELKSRK